ncbi:MAG: hypothetical protein H8D23_23745 [Candidatus Brocadiales bacterium]|nr:hypothetical protein [Candidatus Brocadiales bacterium]
MIRYHLYLLDLYDMCPHGRLHFHKDYDTLEEARQAVVASLPMHGYQIEDLMTREVEKGLVGELKC